MGPDWSQAPLSFWHGGKGLCRSGLSTPPLAASACPPSPASSRQPIQQEGVCFGSRHCLGREAEAG